MRFWYIHPWAYVCLAGLIIVVFALRGFPSKATFPELAIRVAGAAFGLALIALGIWANLR